MSQSCSGELDALEYIPTHLNGPFMVEKILPKVDFFLLFEKDGEKICSENKRFWWVVEMKRFVSFIAFIIIARLAGR